MKQPRKVRAARLLRFAHEGPAFTDGPSGEAAKLYRLWAKSWLVPLLTELVPEIAKGQVQYLGKEL